jgi:hypothetical protein
LRNNIWKEMNFKMLCVEILRNRAHFNNNSLIKAKLKEAISWIVRANYSIKNNSWVINNPTHQIITNGATLLDKA